GSCAMCCCSLASFTLVNITVLISLVYDVIWSHRPCGFSLIDLLIITLVIWDVRIKSSYIANLSKDV
ncbi:hypothetical protein ABN128_32105, partial [Klebsiella variicola subsp. variicola]